MTFTRNGRIKQSNGSKLVSHGVMSDPTILFVDGKYRMWFTTSINPFTSSAVMGIAYAESTTGTTWTPRMDPSNGQPALLVRPTPGGWDAGGIETASVVRKPDGKYFMYYSGDLPPVGAHRWAIGMATSDDGITWTKVGTGPILQGRGGWEGPFTDGGTTVGGVCEPSVLYDADQGLYKMWYSALGAASERLAFRMGYAISSDGVNWTAQPDPVMDVGAPGSWDDAVVSHVNVTFDPAAGKYHLFYFGTSATKYRNAEKQKAAMIPGSIGHAVSTDGITWVRDPAPVLNPVTGTWEAWTVGGPAALVQSGKMKLYYFGSGVFNTYSFDMAIATATITN